MSLEELGKKSYQKANWDDFKGAIEILNKAISKYEDSRLYNNRCYCYFRLKKYDKALEDSNTMIQLFPYYTKSYYRKGEILLELNNLIDAEICFNKVLELDPKCEEARGQLLEVQVRMLCATNRYRRRDAEKALKLCNFNKKDAEQMLQFGGMGQLLEDDVYYSDDEKQCINNKKSPSDPFTDPNNPFNCSSIWVGNVTKSVTEEIIKQIFSKYGKIKSVHIQPTNYCAFVNYLDPTMAGKAMRLFPPNGLTIKETSLVIRYPDNAAKCAIQTKKKHM